MRYELKSVAVWPVVKITFLVSLVIGFCLGLMVALLLVPMLAIMPSLGMPDSSFDTAKLSMGVLVIIMPIFYAFLVAVFNTIGALVATACYNLVAKWGGGFELEFGNIGNGQEMRNSERVMYGSTTYSTQPPTPPAPPRHDTPGGDNI